ncbi:MAG TPA: hypothetical protein VGH76_07355 [Actinomycetospora sp.]|uniref:DF family (seleno)protein n=1 Tax=Actinomycetospora sp. TaxID=1872135 RepID=UPI002F4006A3
MPARSCDPSVELLYFSGCPNHQAFLPHLRQLIREHGVNAPVRLVEITGDDQAQHQRFLGSPSLRINGIDVDPCATGRTDYGMQCRLYFTDNGARGVPPDSWILRALDGGANSERSGGANSG